MSPNKDLTSNFSSFLRVELTFVVRLQVVQVKVRLPVTQDKGQERQDEGVQDAHDGQHVGPTYRAVPQGVLARVLAAHVSDDLRVPAVWEDHAAQHQADSCRGTLTLG